MYMDYDCACALELQMTLQFSVRNKNGALLSVLMVLQVRIPKWI
jgi:hypothetical protein